MATTELTLLFLGVLAAAVTAFGLFYTFNDDWTSPLLVFIGSLLWGLFGMSAFDVETSVTNCCIVSQEYTALVYVGIGFAALTFIFFLAEVLTSLGSSAETSGSPLDD